MTSALDTTTALLNDPGSSDAERTERLKQVFLAARDQSTLGLAAVVEKLADAARNPNWRQPLGDSGLLELTISHAPLVDVKHPLTKQALRLIGNACADCDKNREHVVAAKALSKFILNCMHEDALLPFVIAATLNVCVDYKPAQLQASEAGLSKILVDLVSGPRLASCQSSLSHIMTILELLCNQDPEPTLADPHTPALLLTLVSSDRYDADLDTFLEICTPALAYLTFKEFQSVLLENGGIEVLQLAFYQLYTRFDLEDLDADTKNQLKQVGDAFLAIFADISALDGFLSACPLDGKVVQTLIDWLKLPPSLSHLQTAACLSLGNLSRSDESSTTLLKKDVYSPLLDILSRAIPGASLQPANSATAGPPPQLVHAALSFFKNLAIPAANKPILGNTALLHPPHAILPRLWTSTSVQPQIQFAAVSLTRLLVTSCPGNIHWLCEPTPSGSKHASNLALLVSVAASAEEDPIKLEAARAVSQVCRALHGTAASTILDPAWEWAAHPTPSSDLTTATTTTPENSQQPNPAGVEPLSATSPLTRFYCAHTPEITTSLHQLLTHPRFPALRSDAIFVLALMSRSSSSSSSSASSDSEGARLALHVLQQQQEQQQPIRDDKSKPAAVTGAAWAAVARAITGGGDEKEDELVAELLSHVQVHAPAANTEGAALEDNVEDGQDVKDTNDKGTGDEDKGEDGSRKGKEEVTVERLSLQSQQELVDPQGPKQQQQPARAAEMDRENAMVLVAELLRRFPAELSSLRRPLEAILSKGGELVMRDRQKEQ